MPSYTIQQGDTLMALANKNGLKSWEDILNHAQNKTLKEKSADPGILNPGDQLFIPNKVLGQKQKQTDALHPFKIGKPKAWIRMAIKDSDGAPYAGVKYDLAVEGTTTKGTLADDGIIEVAVPIDAQSGTLTLWTDPANPLKWELRIGHMNPMAEISGVQQRLNNLGFDCGDPDGVVDDDTTAAVKAFQARIGLEPTGTIDDTLRTKLKAYYDNTQDERTQDQTPS
jgi:hypothetical protein